MDTVFAPRPGAAPYSRMVRVQAAMEARLMLRNGEQLVLALVIPLLILVGGVIVAERFGYAPHEPMIDLLTPGVLALAVLSTAFAALAIATGFERRYGVIKRLGASPLPRSGLLLGKVGAVLIVLALQFAVIGVAAWLLGWRPDPAGLPWLVVLVGLGTWALGALGMFLAGVLRAEATLAAANLIYVLLVAGGAVVAPSASYGSFGIVARLLPSGALGDGLREALVAGRLDLAAVAVLVCWGVAGTVLVARTFKWE